MVPTKNIDIIPHLCAPNCRSQCQSIINEKQRNQILNYYRNLNEPHLQLLFVQKCLEINGQVVKHFFTINSKRINVCKNFYLNTLQLSNDFVRKAMNTDSKTLIPSNKNDKTKPKTAQFKAMPTISEKSEDENSADAKPNSGEVKSGAKSKNEGGKADDGEKSALKSKLKQSSSTAVDNSPAKVVTRSSKRSLTNLETPTPKKVAVRVEKKSVSPVPTRILRKSTRLENTSPKISEANDKKTTVERNKATSSNPLASKPKSSAGTAVGNDIAKEINAILATTEGKSTTSVYKDEATTSRKRRSSVSSDPKCKVSLTPTEVSKKVEENKPRTTAGDKIRLPLRKREKFDASLTETDNKREENTSVTEKANSSSTNSEKSEPAKKTSDIVDKPSTVIRRVELPRINVVIPPLCGYGEGIPSSSWIVRSGPSTSGNFRSAPSTSGIVSNAPSTSGTVKIKSAAATASEVKNIGSAKVDQLFTSVTMDKRKYLDKDNESAPSADKYKPFLTTCDRNNSACVASTSTQISDSIETVDDNKTPSANIPWQFVLNRDTQSMALRHIKSIPRVIVCERGSDGELEYAESSIEVEMMYRMFMHHCEKQGHLIIVGYNTYKRLFDQLDLLFEKCRDSLPLLAENEVTIVTLK